ncbi:MAG: cyclic nucleotide-binding domain-containing protein [Nitrospinae bacterium]|nr:cyclic nucleotide-binding domain-containing protein [Nitrospinota bacterium]
MDYVPLVEKYKDGDVIVTEGIVSNNAYVVLSGKVRVVKTVQDRQVVISVLGKGDVFGEMGLIGEAPRSATIVAEGEATLGIIDRKSFLAKMEAIPEDMRFVIKAMVNRLAATTEKLAQVGLKFESTQRVLDSYSYRKKEDH